MDKPIEVTDGGDITDIVHGDIMRKFEELRSKAAKAAKAGDEHIVVGVEEQISMLAQAMSSQLVMMMGVVKGLDSTVRDLAGSVQRLSYELEGEFNAK